MRSAPDGTKRCCRCMDSKPACDFNNCSAKLDGLVDMCRGCERDRDKAHRAKFPEKSRNKVKLYRERHPERVRAKKKHYYITNKMRLLEKSRTWRRRHVTEIREYRRADRKRRPEVYKQMEMRRHDRRRRAPGFATAEQVRARVVYYGERCYLCGAPWTELDHVIPLSRGGSNWASNLRPICRHCNASKNNQKLSEL